MVPAKRPAVHNHVEVPHPIVERHLSGVHWWDPDRLHHLEDMPRFCPSCGGDLSNGISVEYWEAEDRVYHTWCWACKWAGDIVRVRRMIGHEVPDDDH